MVVRLGDYIEEYSVRNKDSEDIPVYSVTNTQGFCQDYFGKEVASKDKSTYKIVPRGCFAYNPSRINVGSIDWQRNEDRVIVSPLYNVFSVSPRLDQQYLYYFLKSDVALQRIKVVATGSVRDNLKFDMLCEFPINYVELDEQRVITHTLDKIKHLKELLQNEIDELDTLIKARFVEMFDLEICEWGTYGNDTNFVDYRGHTPELSDAGTIRMVNAKSVGKGFFKYVDEYVTEDVYDSWMHRGFGHPGDVLFVTEGHTFGNTCLVPDGLTRFALGQRVITIKGHKNKLVNEFIFAYMQTDRFWKDINAYRTGGTAQGIRSKDLAKVRLPLPSLDLQRTFATFVTQVDKSKVAIQKALDETQLLFDSLMQEYFG